MWATRKTTADSGPPSPHAPRPRVRQSSEDDRDDSEASADSPAFLVPAVAVEDLLRLSVT